MEYAVLVAGVAVLMYGIICYFLQKFDITENNKLYRYRPKESNLLIKWKIFKYNLRFNYFLLIPYLFAWVLFIVILILYCVYWCGVSQLKNVLSSKIFIGSMGGIILLMMLYIGIIQVIISRNYINEKKDKEAKKIEKDEIKRALKKIKNNQRTEKKIEQKKER